MYQIQSSFHLHGFLETRIGGRPENQDACGFSDTPVGALIVVCDGMGGMNGGSIASSTAIQTIFSIFSEATENEDPDELIKTSVTEANKAIFETGKDDPNLTGMGTTLVLILIDGDCARVVSIGDSRLYQLRSKQTVFRTDDDSVVGQLVKSGAITEEEARVSDTSNIITKALGVSEEVEFDIQSLPYDKKDRFLLCSDGFWGSMPEKEILRILEQKDDLNLVFERAMNKVEKIGQKTNPDHFDNYTAAVFDVGKYSKKRSAMEKKLKILSFVLSVLLLLSLCFSFYLYRSAHPSKKSLQDENLTEVGAPADTTEETTAPLPDTSPAGKSKKK